MVAECRVCELVYLRNPPPEEALYDEYYGVEDPEAAHYRVDGPIPALAELSAINTQRVDALAARKQGGAVLDVGCGRGYFLATARQRGFDVRGIDVTERPVDYARRAFGVPAAVRTLDDILADGRRFDAVTLWHVLEHFEDPFAALRQVRSLLNAGGVCLVEVPNLNSLKFLLARQKWEGAIIRSTTGPSSRRAPSGGHSSRPASLKLSACSYRIGYRAVVRPMRRSSAR